MVVTNKEIWENNYQDTGDPFNSSNKYDQELIRIKAALLHPMFKNKHKLIIDIGCGTGDFLLHERNKFKEAIGIDFSKRMIKQFSKKIKEQRIKNICLYHGEAKNIPLSSKEKADFIFSYATLYYVPDIQEVIREINRTLDTEKGIAVLEFGNSLSLEYLLGLINQKIFGWSKHYCTNLFKLNRILKKNNLEVLAVRKFQLIPIASMPTSLSNLFKRILRVKINGKMLDERLSEFPILSFFAYRNIYIVQKYF